MSWIEVSQSAIANNISELRKNMSPKTKFMGVVKANAYGHGALEIARLLKKQNVDFLGVSSAKEALELREIGLPILILGYTKIEFLEKVVLFDFRQTVFDLNFANQLNKIAKSQNKIAKVHIKIDTGMSRLGFSYFPDLHEFKEKNQKIIKDILKISELPNLEIEGIFTHFSSSDTDKKYTQDQFNRFQDLISELEKLGLEIPIKHACNSSATILYPEMHMDMVRCGIAMYGHYNSETETKIVNLIPAMSLKTRIVNIFDVPAGTKISYCGTYETLNPTKIATIAIGYADGYPRGLSNIGRVMVNSQIANIIGNICMDQCMIDVTNVNNIAVEDPVLLFGTSNGKKIAVEDLAKKMSTISYEILCGINKRVIKTYCT